jgi:hypothetical protein
VSPGKKKSGSGTSNPKILRLVGLIQIQAQTLETQSRRLDQYEQQQRASEQAAQRRHEELLVRVDRILDMLTTRLN